jgi:hypothetical protein
METYGYGRVSGSAKRYIPQRLRPPYIHVREISTLSWLPTTAVSVVGKSAFLNAESKDDFLASRSCAVAVDVVSLATFVRPVQHPGARDA